MVEVQTQVRVASGVEAIVVKAADRVEPLDSECINDVISYFAFSCCFIIFNINFWTLLQMKKS